MNTKVAVLGLVLALVLGFGTISYASAPSTVGTPAHVGDFNLTYNSSASVVSGVSYSENGSSLTVANNIYVNASTSSVMSGFSFPAGYISLKNGSVFASLEGHALIVADTGSSPSIVLSSSYNVTRIYVDLNADAWFGGFMSAGMSLSAKMSVYEMALPGGGVAIIFGNSNSAKMGPGTVEFSSTSSPLFMGIVVKQGFANYIRAHISDTSRFTYNATTGLVSGKHVSFGFSSGKISDFTYIDTGTVVFNSVSVTGNGSFESENGIPVMPFNKPVIIGGLFAYASNTSIVVVHDNPVAQSNFLVSNGTISFAVPSALNVTQFGLTAGFRASLNVSASIYSNEMSGNVTFGMNGQIRAGSTGIYIHGSGFRAMMFIRDGSVSISGNVISVKTSSIAKIEFIAPVGLQGSVSTGIHSVMTAIMNNEVSTMEEISYVNGSIHPVTVQYNSSVSMSLQRAVTNNVSLTVSSSNHRGTVITVFVSSAIIASGSKITVSFPGESINAYSASVNATIRATSVINAYYSTVNVTGGMLVVIHIPHFSNHTIDITATPSTSQAPSPLLSGNGIYYLAGGIGVVLVAAAAAAIIYRRRKA